MAIRVSTQYSLTIIDLDQVIDMTPRDHTPAFGPPGPPTGQKTINEALSNFIDLTSDYDNPCFDPAELITIERTATRRPPPQEDVTWDALYPQLPEDLKHQLDADNKPAPSSEQPTSKDEETPVPPRHVQTNTMEEETEDEEFTDDFDPEDEMLLIELADQVAAQAAGGSRETTTASEGESKFGLCPFCERKSRVFTLEKIGGSNESRPVFRCSDSECLYVELLHEGDK